MPPAWSYADIFSIEVSTSQITILCVKWTCIYLSPTHKYQKQWLVFWKGLLEIAKPPTLDNFFVKHKIIGNKSQSLVQRPYVYDDYSSLFSICLSQDGFEDSDLLFYPQSSEVTTSPMQLISSLVFANRNFIDLLSMLTFGFWKPSGSSSTPLPLLFHWEFYVCPPLLLLRYVDIKTTQVLVHLWELWPLFHS